MRILVLLLCCRICSRMGSGLNIRWLVFIAFGPDAESQFVPGRDAPKLSGDDIMTTSSLLIGGVEACWACHLSRD